MVPNPQLRIAGVLLLLALLAGALAFWGTQRYLERAASEVESRWRNRFTPASVLVVRRDLEAGTVVAPDDVARREVPAAFVPSGTLGAGEAAAAVGRRLLYGLRAGDPLTRSALQSEAQASLAARLRDGNRAVTVPVDEVSSQAGLVRPGDRVDLLLAEERLEGAERCVVVRSLLESLPVLATGQMQQAIDPGNGSGVAPRDHGYSTITLDVTPEQAQQLAVGLRVGELIPMLRGDDDRAPVRLASLGTQRTGCRVPAPPAGIGAAPGAAAPDAAAPGAALELMIGGRDSVERSRHWFPEG